MTSKLTKLLKRADPLREQLLIDVSFNIIFFRLGIASMAYWGTCPRCSPRLPIVLFFGSFKSRKNSDIRLHVFSYAVKNIHSYSFITIYCMNFIIFLCVILKLFSLSFVPPRTGFCRRHASQHADDTAQKSLFLKLEEVREWHLPCL